MTRSRRPLITATLLLAGLLVLAQTQWCLALVGIVWRSVVLSWDNPATQLVEDVASQAIPHTDPGRSLRDHAIAAARASARLRPAETPPGVHKPARSRGITRSPPA
jgi:hypothetical protein